MPAAVVSLGFFFFLVMRWRFFFLPPFFKRGNPWCLERFALCPFFVLGDLFFLAPCALLCFFGLRVGGFGGVGVPRKNALETVGAYGAAAFVPFPLLMRKGRGS